MDDIEEIEKRKKTNKFKEKIKRTFRKIALTGMIGASLAMPSYPASMYTMPISDLPGYKYEIDLIRKGDEVSLHGGECYIYYKKAMGLIKEKQDKIGEGENIDLDTMRAYTVYAMARAPPEPEYAEPYLLEAKELAKKYYEIWKDPIFLDLHAAILENLGFIYFDVAERVRKGERAILLLTSSIKDSDEIIKDRIVVGSYNISYFSRRYPCKEIISSENFTKIVDYYRKAKEYYMCYLDFYEENIKPLDNPPDTIEYYKKKNDRVLSHLKIIDDILSKYDLNYKKESSTKEEKKEIAEKKNNNNKQEVKEEKKESKTEKVNWKEIEKKDIQEGL
jgi:hypothetical protein